MAKIATVHTPSKARGLMKKALREIIDPSPTVEEQAALWKHFDSTCIYCGTRMEAASRVGHLDHLVSSGTGYRNHIGNRVLACRTCNGDEKREKDWRAFLESKCPDKMERDRRVALIDTWQRKHPPLVADLSPLETQLEAAFTTAGAAFNKAVADLKSAVAKAAGKAKG